MKQLITLIIALFVVNTLFAQIVPSSCEANDSVKNIYIEDARSVAFDKIFAQALPEKDSIFIDAQHADTILKALLAIHNAVDLAARDSVVRLFRIHYYQDPYLKYISLMADSSLVWVQSLKKNIFPSGKGFIDTLYSIYGARFHRIGSFENNLWFQLWFPNSVNTRAIENRFLKIDGVKWSSIVAAGDGSKIEHVIYKTFTEVIYKYSWDDCPSGCHYDRYWKFRVYLDCSVEFVQSYGDANPEVLSTNSAKKITLEIFPNPFEKFITLKGINEDVKFEIYRLDGKLILEGKSKNKQINNLDDLTLGIYMLHIHKENNSMPVIIIKNN